MYGYTYLVHVNSYDLLKAGVDLNLKEYCNRDRNYGFTTQISPCRLTDSPSVDEIIKGEYVEITDNNIMEYCYSLPEVVFGVLHHYGKIERKKYFKLSMVGELIK